MKITLCQVSFTVPEMPVVHFNTPQVTNGEGTANQRLLSQASSGLVFRHGRGRRGGENTLCTGNRYNEAKKQCEN